MKRVCVYGNKWEIGDDFYYIFSCNLFFYVCNVLEIILYWIFLIFVYYGKCIIL